MVSRRRIRVGPEQEEMLLDFNPEISGEFSSERAAAAGLRRKRRKGPLALNERTRNFMKNVDHLFIPYSTFEIDMVISPVSKIKSGKYQAKERVREKYKDEDVPKSKVEHWASYASQNSIHSIFGRVRRVQEDARGSFVRLCQGLTSSDLTFTKESIMGSEEALKELQRYIYTLKTFVGFSETEIPARRKFVQDRWTHKIAEQTEWANAYLQNLSEPRLLETYDEALHNAWCRDEHWRSFLKNFVPDVRRGQTAEPDWIDVPDWLYENDPEAVMPPDFFDPYYDAYFPFSKGDLHDTPPAS